jgi:RimJ/RimL family protein N-acetyltransferase
METDADVGGSRMNAGSSSTNYFTGKLVRLTAYDSEKDAEMMSRWGLNSEFSQLSNSDPAYMWHPKQIKEWLEAHLGELYYFTIRALSDDKVIGNVDLGGVDWAAGNCWVGIGIGEQEYWGKGFGTEAMKLALGFAFGQLNLNRVSLTVFSYNLRGYRSYCKCGFKEEGRQRQWMQRGGERYDLIYMGILREEWEAISARDAAAMAEGMALQEAALQEAALQEAAPSQAVPSQAALAEAQGTAQAGAK